MCDTLSFNANVWDEVEATVKLELSEYQWKRYTNVILEAIKRKKEFWWIEESNLFSIENLEKEAEERNRKQEEENKNKPKKKDDDDDLPF